MIALILEANREIEQCVWQDLTTDATGGRKKPTGAKGMAAEQVLRFAVLKVKAQLDYRDLQARGADSICLRGFCLVGHGEVPVFKTLQADIKRIRPQTWKAVNDFIIECAYALGVEDGKQVRIDTTSVKCDIHHPTDSHQRRPRFSLTQNRVNLCDQGRR